MTVKDLKKLLEGVSDDTKVLLPLSQEFDGGFYYPCTAESGVSQMPSSDLSEKDIDIMDNLKLDIPNEDFFILVPCGFFEEKSHTHELN